MTISLAYGSTVLDLDPDLLWSDEHAWSPVSQSVDRAVTGALIIQADGDAATPGRPITLKPEDEASAWMSLAVLEQLRAWAAIPLAVFTLTLRGIDRQVILRHHDQPALEASAVINYRDVDPLDNYRVTLKFMEI